ncbi:hypothetical protein [Photobacterium leiognathi]|nr:hypothetical protein [Photobacterium leiognathi]
MLRKAQRKQTTGLTELKPFEYLFDQVNELINIGHKKYSGDYRLFEFKPN